MKKIAPDKWKHIIVGIPLGAVLQWVAIYFLPTYLSVSVLVSFIVLLAGCYSFELFSLVTGKGHYELLDVLAGAVGGTIGIGIVVLIKHNIR